MGIGIGGGRAGAGEDAQAEVAASFDPLVAVDGKSVAGSFGGLGGSGVYLMAVFRHGDGIVVGQRRVLTGGGLAGFTPLPDGVTASQVSLPIRTCKSPFIRSGHLSEPAKGGTSSRPVVGACRRSGCGPTRRFPGQDRFRLDQIDDGRGGDRCDGRRWPHRCRAIRSRPRCTITTAQGLTAELWHPTGATRP